MLIPFRDVGSGGLNFDMRSNQLPVNQWSDARNVRFDNNRVIKANNFKLINDSNGVLVVPTEPYFIQQYRNPSEAFWILAGLADVWAVDDDESAAAITKITRAASQYTTISSDRWNGGMFNGVGVLNNGRDVPQVWSPVNLATLLQDLPNWPASYKAKVIRPYLNFLVAFDITKASGTEYPIMVKWSDAADPGTVPVTWDETDPTHLAGEQVLADGPFSIIDAVPYAGALYIMTEQTTWAMTFIGGQYVFSFQRIFGQAGTIAQGCAAPIKDKLFVVTRDDIILHDGHTLQSIADKRVRKFFFDQASIVTVDRSHNPVVEPNSIPGMFVVPHVARSEMWICYPVSGESTMAQALVWNWKYDTWTFMDLPRCHFAASELPAPESTGDTWDEDSVTTWDGETTQVWDDPSFLRYKEKFRAAMVSPAFNVAEYDRDRFTDVTGAAYRSYAERRGLAPIGLMYDQSVMNDKSAMKQIKGLWLTINGQTGAVLQVYIGGYDHPDDSPTEQGPFAYTIGTTDYLDVYMVNRFFSIRVEETTSNYWELTEYQLDIMKVSGY